MHLINADGSDLIRLDPKFINDIAGGNATDPSWSPDGEKIVFQQWGGSPPQLVNIMNADGTDVQLLSVGDVPAWSPDGEEIAFIKRRPKQIFGDLYLIGVDGNNLRQLTEGDSLNKPSWSPDGKQLLMHSYDGIVVMNADGSDRKLLHPSNSMPTWSTDGRYIFFVYYQSQKPMIMNSDGTNPTMLFDLPDRLYGYISQQPAID